MVTGGSSRPHALAISLNNSTAIEESPPNSKKLSSGRIGECCSRRCQIGVRVSIMVAVELFLALHIIVSDSRSEHRDCAFPLPSAFAGTQHQLRRMREGPIKFARLLIKRAKWQCTVIDARDGYNFGIVSCSENLVGSLQVPVLQRGLHDAYAILPQEANDTPPRNSGKKRPVRNGRVHHAVFGHKDIGGCQL